jgi:hypothetical protein
MKKLLFPLLVIILFSCESIKKDKSLLPSSSGKYGEVLIVVDTVFEKAKTGTAINKIFFQAVEGLPQQEYQFRASTVPPKGFKSILRQSRNILKLNIKKNLKTKIEVVRNVWAKNQLMIQINAATDSDASRILTKNKQTIRNYFNEEEVKRLQGYFKKNNQENLSNALSERIGVNMVIPKGFVKMEDKDNGIWFKMEKKVGQHQIIQGLIAYTTPYNTDSIFINSYFIEQRDLFCSEFVQGSRESSFMNVYSEFNPIQKEVNLNGLYTVEYRGLWNMKNDFMGGPYVHYTFVDEENSRVINLDGFVYAPKFNKREYLRELEALLKTAKLNS